MGQRPQGESPDHNDYVGLEYHARATGAVTCVTEPYVLEGNFSYLIFLAAPRGAIREPQSTAFCVDLLELSRP